MPFRLLRFVGSSCPTDHKRPTARYRRHRRHRALSVHDTHRGRGHGEGTGPLSPRKRGDGGAPAILPHRQPLQQRLPEPRAWLLLQIETGATFFKT